MKRLIEKEFVDMGKLNPSEKKEVEAANQSRLADLQHKYAGIRMELHGREQELYDRLAKQTGFSGYADGDTAYLDIQKKQFLRQPLTYDETAALKAFFNAKVSTPEYADICLAYKDTDRQELEDRVWAEQRYLNDVLTRTRWKYDTNLRVDGKLVQPPVSWNFWSSEYQDRMEVPCTESVTDRTGRGIPVDRGVASALKQFWSAGIVTGNSCSGLVKDHPYHRYRMDDELGRWKKGQYRYQNQEFCHAYMTFPLDSNDAEIMTRIEAKAKDWGWTAERRQIYGKDSLCFYPAHTLDGTSRSDIFDENRQRNEGYKGEMDDITWQRRFAEVERMHGGIIPYTDAMIEHLWRKLTRGILETQRQVMDERLKTNIEAGQAVTLYEYDSDNVQLSDGALAEVFDRAGMTLDRATVDRPMDRTCIFVVDSKGRAELLPKDAEIPDNEKVAGRYTLSYLMASQLKDAVHGSSTEDRVTVMVHPEPQTAEDWKRFTFTEQIPQYEYYRYMVNEGDLTQMVANRFGSHLYEAAVHAYEHSFQKTLDDVKARQLISDIEIRTRPDHNTYIRCRIQGQWQMGRQMTPEDTDYYRYRMSQSDKAYNGVAPELAHKYFRDEISRVLNGQDRTAGRGM